GSAGGGAGSAAAGAGGAPIGGTSGAAGTHVGGASGSGPSCPGNTEETWVGSSIFTFPDGSEQLKANFVFAQIGSNGSTKTFQPRSGTVELALGASPGCATAASVSSHAIGPNDGVMQVDYGSNSGTDAPSIKGVGETQWLAVFGADCTQKLADAVWWPGNAASPPTVATNGVLDIAFPSGHLHMERVFESDAACVGKPKLVADYAKGVANPIWITSGPDGNLWFTELVNKVDRITTAGVVTEFSIPTTGASPGVITPGPDGNLWFTEAIGQIGRITPAGVITEFAAPTVAYPYSPHTPNQKGGGITAGPDGRLWFITSSCKIGTITTAGVLGEEYPVLSAADQALGYSGCPGYGITAGPDSALWFIANIPQKAGGPIFVERMSTAGEVTTYPVHQADESVIDASFAQIAAGADGNLWFLTPWAFDPKSTQTPPADLDELGVASTSGWVTNITAPTTTNDYPSGIAAGPDGNIWFTTYSALIRVTPAGTITEVPLPAEMNLNGAAAITGGPDGNIWYVCGGICQLPL
ncbi:MAG TPA: hypothetical protein VHO67_03255, partial [Polyangia bacterium]|nr:hypothetical protein [Polyangia bacterium]